MSTTLNNEENPWADVDKMLRTKLAEIVDRYKKEDPYEPGPYLGVTWETTVQELKDADSVRQEITSHILEPFETLCSNARVPGPAMIRVNKLADRLVFYVWARAAVATPEIEEAFALPTGLQLELDPAGYRFVPGPGTLPVIEQDQEVRARALAEKILAMGPPGGRQALKELRDVNPCLYERVSQHLKSLAEAALNRKVDSV